MSALGIQIGEVVPSLAGFGLVGAGAETEPVASRQVLFRDVFCAHFLGIPAEWPFTSRLDLKVRDG